MSSANSTERETPHTDLTDKTSRSRSPQFDILVSDKDYEVCKQLFELCTNAAMQNIHKTYINTADRIEQDDIDVMTSKDLKVVMEKLGLSITEAEIGMFFKNVRATGHFSLNDVMSMIQHEEFNQSDFIQDHNELWEAFQFFDRNGDGNISISDLQEAVECMGLNVKSLEIIKMIAGADSKGDGKIEFKEFVEMVQDD